MENTKPEALRKIAHYNDDHLTSIEIAAIYAASDELTRLRAEIESLRSVSFDLNRALIGAISQLRMAGECAESGRYDEAILHARSLPREKREAVERYVALQSTKETK